ncbi:ATPase, AAA-type, core [uncultured Caudovirales phage]|uniref:ATPase, AAA-type, core n=1 Tax=uncultured Caudovirales phage TaxID=2100421 RepID=A0A6J7WHF7_9CAUD|nr:ATPase, AAA-type, core [uncultured Caudovirales phage]
MIKQGASMSNVSFIRIKSGAYRATDVSGQVFQLVEQYKNTAKGGYVTVKNGDRFPGMPVDIRVKVNGMSDYDFVSEAEYIQQGNTPVAEAVALETSAESDEEVIERIRQRFEILDEMTTAATNGEIRAMIVSGPPGVGKSFGVERIVEKACLFDTISGKRLRAEVVKGSATALGLYSTLYKYSDSNCMLVFDDCDSILLDDVALNLLKGALDSGKKRKISWLSDSSLLRREGIPDSFNFNGSVVFITNLKFDKMKSQKLRDHLDALQSRCHYLDLTLDTMRDKIMRIKQIAKDGELFAEYDFEPCVQDEIIEFMTENKNRFREMSLRMAIKIADLRKSFPLKWKAMAQITCMRPA